MLDLTEIRERIDAIDTSITDLLMERMEVSADVAAYKAATGKPVFDRTRERQNIANAASRVPPELASYAAKIQSVLMEASRAAQYKALGRASRSTEAVTHALDISPATFPASATVACQGVEGAYQQIAVDRMFRRPTLTFLDSFEAVFEAVEEGRAEFGVLPIENSTAGSVNHVFDLMCRHDFHIVRTCRLKIDHNLLVYPGTRKRDVSIIYSHQQAISQCANYIAKIPNCRVHVTENTAKAAALVARYKRGDVAALASRACAELYGLEVAEACVQDRANNYTRFACFTKNLTIYPGADRVSLLLVLRHEPGALYDVLARISALDLNLLKLESRPVAARDFEFMFFFDVECQAASTDLTALLNSLSDVCEELRFLGAYAEVI